MTQEGEEDSLFVLSGAVIPAVSAGAIGPLPFDQTNCTDGAEANDDPILLSGCTSNLRSEYTMDLRRQGKAPPCLLNVDLTYGPILK